MRFEIKEQSSDEEDAVSVGSEHRANPIDTIVTNAIKKKASMRPEFKKICQLNLDLISQKSEDVEIKEEPYLENAVDTVDEYTLSFESVLHVLTNLGMIDIGTNVQNILSQQAKEVDLLWLLIHDDVDEEFANVQKLQAMVEIIAMIHNPKFISQQTRQAINGEICAFFKENGAYKLSQSQVPVLRKQFRQLSLNYKSSEQAIKELLIDKKKRLIEEQQRLNQTARVKRSKTDYLAFKYRDKIAKRSGIKSDHRSLGHNRSYSLTLMSA